VNFESTHLFLPFISFSCAIVPTSMFFRPYDKEILIAAVDISGFIVEACELIRREPGNVSDIDYGTVNADRFLAYSNSHLNPTLGNYHFGEARSIVVLDHAMQVCTANFLLTQSQQWEP